jgi:hypothetical protein
VKAGTTIRTPRAEAGIALLISIFVLLLISVVAIALIVSSGTETSLAGNYRSSASVYYAASAGLEEARARLSPKDPNSFKTTWAAFYPAPGATLPTGTVGYVLNPGPTETAGNLLTTYPDTEYDSEFGPGKLAGATVLTTLSVWNKTPMTTNLSFPPPLYKWVRINAVSEQSLQLADTYPFDGTQDPTPLYYDGAHLNDTNTGSQLFEITALAVLPNGNAQNSQKLVQYLVAPQPLNLNFPAALILDGNTPQFGASPSPSYWVKGIDQGSVGTCNPGGAVSAMGYTDTSYTVSNFEKPSNSQGISVASPNLTGNYTNAVATNPDIAAVTLSPNLSTVGGLNGLVQTITANADAVIAGPVTESNSTNVFPAAMSATNPVTIVVNGDLTFSGWRNTGYGLLLVTGKLTYDPDANWDGIILVIGQGWMYSHQNSSSTTQIQGAVFLAKTVGLSSSSAPISPNFDFGTTPNSLSNGIYYSSCWIQASMPNLSYKILSFHEIAQ